MLTVALAGGTSVTRWARPPSARMFLPGNVAALVADQEGCDPLATLVKGSVTGERGTVVFPPDLDG